MTLRVPTLVLAVLLLAPSALSVGSGSDMTIPTRPASASTLST